MSLFGDPETHAANPPETWTVAKVAERCWRLETRGGDVIESVATKREAESLKTEGFAFDMWHKEERWYAGESVAQWKPWAQVQEERERHALWLKSKEVRA